jgi:hypothetical protein
VAAGASPDHFQSGCADAECRYTCAASGQPVATTDDAFFCVEGERLACVSNDDCPATRTCRTIAPLADRFCVLGDRGEGEGGTPCVQDDECAHALCLSRNGPEAQGRCASPCIRSADCPDAVPQCVRLPQLGWWCVSLD